MSCSEEALKVNSSLVQINLRPIVDMYERSKGLYNKQIELFKENRVEKRGTQAANKQSKAWFG